MSKLVYWFSWMVGLLFIAFIFASLGAITEVAGGDPGRLYSITAGLFGGCYSLILISFWDKINKEG